MGGSGIITFYRTIRYLKPIQILYRGKLILKRFLPAKIIWNEYQLVASNDLCLEDSIPLDNSYICSSAVFSFLNLSHPFPFGIDWNWLVYGRLWAYNLNYFEYLNQRNCSKEEGIVLINDFLNQLLSCSVGLESYPLSLRCINWIRFFIKHKLKDKRYDVILFQQLELLTHKLEYHLMGNHLLENGFALLFGAYYFGSNDFYKQAKRILIPELEEQTLVDGANFELSPMYHCIMLFRVLDCYNLVKCNPSFSRELLPIFEKQCCRMLGWLSAITFNNGDIPLFNDAAFKIAPTTAALFDYADRLGLSYRKTTLRDSGYRKLVNLKFEAVIDVAKVGPDYQPGHAHADTFNFELHVNNRSVIVDTGTSTYEVNQIRFYERSTAAHNTVVVDNSNSSEVWAGHRVGRRAFVTILEETADRLVAVHDGYSSKKLKHIRSFEMKDGCYNICDTIASEAVAYLHFHPSEKIKLEKAEIIGSDYHVKFIGADSIELFDTYYAPEFNKRVPSVGVKIYFKNKLQTIFG
ncbi:alginate lyase family protein [Bacteroides sp. GD17]|jgi:hypothetical protein|uniref:alginate lyase family protein n=1 Tax=Bacteroides sp. GD17 TaxID=3139826 RepID=UPI00313D18DD